jgi:Nitrate/nitrite transporter
MKAMLVIAFIPLVVLIGTATWIYQLLGACFVDRYWCISSPGMECKYFYNSIGYVSKKAVGSVVGIGGMAGGIGGVVMSKLGGGLFDHYKALGHIETGYTIMFTICAIAYLVAWIVMKALVPKYKVIDDL